MLQKREMDVNLIVGSCHIIIISSVDTYTSKEYKWKPPSNHMRCNICYRYCSLYLTKHISVTQPSKVFIINLVFGRLNFNTKYDHISFNDLRLQLPTIHQIAWSIHCCHSKAILFCQSILIGTNFTVQIQWNVWWIKAILT